VWAHRHADSRRDRPGSTGARIPIDVTQLQPGDELIIVPAPAGSAEVLEDLAAGRAVQADTIHILRRHQSP
jgi:hypothetical protein